MSRIVLFFQQRLSSHRAAGSRTYIEMVAWGVTSIPEFTPNFFFVCFSVVGQREGCLWGENNLP